ncbi:MAG: YfiR family protein [Terriglobales bacterium]
MALQIIFSVLVLLGLSTAQQLASTDYQVKAAYLFNFAKFVEWPANTFSSPGSRLEICVLGSSPFGRGLEDSIAGKTVGGRRLLISHRSDPVQARSCQIVFIAISDKEQIRQTLQQLSGASVLTVGDTSGFIEDGGMINFVLDGDRVRFEANVNAAELVHLKLSARLLTVAKAVIGKSQDEKH